MPGARRIYQETLDRMTAAILAGDPATYAKHAALPFELRLMDGAIVCLETGDVVTAIGNFADQLRQSEVTEFIRTCDSAQFIAPDHISGFHTSRVKSGARDILSPYVTQLDLYLSKDGLWRVQTSDTALSSADWEMIPNWISKSNGNTYEKSVSDREQRLKMFQTILDRVSAAFLSGDVESWLNSASVPFQVITRHGIETFTTYDDLRADFARYQAEFKTHHVTDIIREAKTAELINGDQMVGTFRTHILNRSSHVVPPWDASMTLRRENGLWRVTTVMRAIGHTNWSAQNRADIEDVPYDTPKKGDHK